MIYVHEIPNEDGCVLTIENPEEVICTGESLLDEQQMELNDNENKEEVSCTKGVVAIEEEEAGVKCEKEVAVTPDEPSLHWDILTPPPAENWNNCPDEPMDLCINKTTPVKEEQEHTLPTTQQYADDNALPDIHQGKSFPTWIFQEQDAEIVLSIPDLPDGKKLYKIYTSNDNWHEVTSDLRFFDMKTSSRSRYNGVCKVGKCLGSWICPNRSCTFRGTSHEHQANRINWKGVRGQKDIKLCQICETVAMREGCGARKLVEYNPTT